VYYSFRPRHVQFGFRSRVWFVIAERKENTVDIAMHEEFFLNLTFIIDLRSAYVTQFLKQRTFALWDTFESI
jgi:hypothetical protein